MCLESFFLDVKKISPNNISIKPFTKKMVRRWYEDVKEKTWHKVQGKTLKPILWEWSPWRMQGPGSILNTGCQMNRIEIIHAKAFLPHITIILIRRVYAVQIILISGLVTSWFTSRKKGKMLLELTQLLWLMDSKLYYAKISNRYLHYAIKVTLKIFL